MNERVLTVGEEDQGEVVLGCQQGGSVVEDTVRVPGLQAGSTRKQGRFKVADSRKGFGVKCWEHM